MTHKMPNKAMQRWMRRELPVSATQNTHMPDPPLESSSDNRARLGRGSPPGMPRWVKIFGLITGIVLIVLFVIQHLPGLGGMGGHH